MVSAEEGPQGRVKTRQWLTAVKAEGEWAGGQEQGSKALGPEGLGVPSKVMGPGSWGHSSGREAVSLPTFGLLQSIPAVLGTWGGKHSSTPAMQGLPITVVTFPGPGETGLGLSEGSSASWV